jgi:folate-dependent phosphoribosylglycinamide formyltransferase PurN
MRIGILAHSFTAALHIYDALQDLPESDVYLVLSPSPTRSAWSNHAANLMRLGIATLKSIRILRLVANRRLVPLFRPLDDDRTVERLKNLDLDVGLHKAGVIYRQATIGAFRVGILNPHIGLLPAYRGRSVMEWSLLQGDPVGITVFFIDAGIDTGERIVVSEQVDISGRRSVAEAKEYLFSLDGVFFRKALMMLREGDQTFHRNDGSGRRYYVMSRLFTGVVDQLLDHKLS